VGWGGVFESWLIVCCFVWGGETSRGRGQAAEAEADWLSYKAENAEKD
jgi:hypothetical protein